jgi:hypothetical protein
MTIDPADLEREIHDALRRLPEPRAPHTLSVGVMAAVQARRTRSWYRETWVVACAMGAVVGIGIGIGVVLGALDGGQTAWRMVAVWVAGPWPFPAEARRLLDVAATVWTLWRMVFEPAIYYASMLALVLGGGLTMGALALDRLTFSRREA